MEFELVFKRGGDTPAEIKSRHATEQKAVQEAKQELRRQRAAGWTSVWLAYDIWEIPVRGRPKRIKVGVTLQRPS